MKPSKKKRNTEVYILKEFLVRKKHVEGYICMSKQNLIFINIILVSFYKKNKGLFPLLQWRWVYNALLEHRTKAFNKK